MYVSLYNKNKSQTFKVNINFNGNNQSIILSSTQFSKLRRNRTEVKETLKKIEKWEKNLRLISSRYLNGIYRNNGHENNY